MDRSLLLDGKQWRSKMASTAATNFQRASGRLLHLFVIPQGRGVTLLKIEVYVKVCCDRHSNAKDRSY